MTTKNELVDLAERVQGLDGPDREVDALVQRALAGKPTEHWFADVNGDLVTDNHAPAYTADLNAAMTLRPEGVTWQITGDDAACVAWCGQSPRIAALPTPALALTAAALLARAESLP